MPIGQSGRIVIEIDPELKQELYSSLEDEGLTLKQWFLDRVTEHLRGRNQLSLQLVFHDGEIAADYAAKTRN
ncbi:MAG: hypothetical protein LJE91_13355 [Gammaproteobacteria bacterium]|nr:hypothetical protein [Gammaproteobacteria bacterium]